MEATIYSPALAWELRSRYGELTLFPNDHANPLLCAWERSVNLKNKTRAVKRDIG
jgi:hypothetical protein